LGELTTLLRPPSWILEGGEGKVLERKGRERKGERRRGKRRGGERRSIDPRLLGGSIEATGYCPLSIRTVTSLITTCFVHIRRFYRGSVHRYLR